METEINLPPPLLDKDVIQFQKIYIAWLEQELYQHQKSSAPSLRAFTEKIREQFKNYMEEKNHE